MEGCCRPFFYCQLWTFVAFLIGFGPCCMRARPCQRVGSNASLAGNCWCSRQRAVGSRCGRGWQLFNVAHFVTFWANWARVDDDDGGRAKWKRTRAKGGCDFWQSTCNSHTHSHTHIEHAVHMSGQSIWYQTGKETHKNQVGKVESCERKTFAQIFVKFNEPQNRARLTVNAMNAPWLPSDTPLPPLALPLVSSTFFLSVEKA